MVNPTAVYTFITKGAPLIGWGAILSFLAWAYKKSVSLSIAYTKQHEAGQKAMSQIDLLSSNHFPHMEKGIESLNTKTDEGNRTLTEISKGIAVLVDRRRE